MLMYENWMSINANTAMNTKGFKRQAFYDGLLGEVLFEWEHTLNAYWAFGVELHKEEDGTYQAWNTEIYERGHTASSRASVSSTKHEGSKIASNTNEQEFSPLENRSSEAGQTSNPPTTQPTLSKQTSLRPPHSPPLALLLHFAPCVGASHI